METFKSHDRYFSREKEEDILHIFNRVSEEISISKTELKLKFAIESQYN